MSRASFCVPSVVTVACCMEEEKEDGWTEGSPCL